MALELMLLRVVRITTVIMGIMLTWLAYKGHRNKNSRGLLFLSIGFLIITAGTVVEGILFEFLHYDILVVHLVESVIVALGFLSFIYAVYGVPD